MKTALLRAPFSLRGGYNNNYWFTGILMIFF